MTPKSKWHVICLRHVVYARRWDLTDPVNRAGLRRWIRRAWWAKHGTVVFALLGSLVGIPIGAILQLVLR